MIHDLFPDSYATYEMMWKSRLEPNRQQIAT
jgi:hypothetical protein